MLVCSVVRLCRFRLVQPLKKSRLLLPCGVGLIGIGWIQWNRCSLLNCNLASIPTTTNLGPEKILTICPCYETGYVSGIYWIVRLAFRALRLWMTFTPLVIIYPLFCWTNTTKSMWWFMMLEAMYMSGPCLIKLAQWASTRRDLFSREFCDRFSQLHRGMGRKTRAWKETVLVLDETFGKGKWQLLFSQFNRDPIGSGCIAQVYRATVRPQIFSDLTGVSMDELPTDECIPVAIKIAHRTVLSQIQMDLGILRFAASLLQILAPSLQLVDPVECAKQFQAVLEKQVDLRNEGRALQRFQRNFSRDNRSVRFPTVLCYTHNLLVETFEYGVHVNELVSEKMSAELDSVYNSTKLRHKAAIIGARSLLKMIFVDNFVHGDLHPGNVLVRVNKSDVEAGEYSDSGGIGKRIWNKIKIIMGLDTGSDYSNLEDPTVIFLDTGITVEQTPENLHNLKAVFSAIVDDRGEEVGQLLLTRSPWHRCKNPMQFCKEIGSLVHLAIQNSSLEQLHIAELLSQLFATVSKHQVALEPSFCCVILAIMVLEGVGRSLDPTLNIFDYARPYLLRVALRQPGK